MSSYSKAFEFLKLTFTPVLVGAAAKRKRASSLDSSSSVSSSLISSTVASLKSGHNPKAKQTNAVPGRGGAVSSPSLFSHLGRPLRSRTSTPLSASPPVRGVRNYGHTCYVASSLQVAHSVSLWSPVSPQSKMIVLDKYL